MSRSLSRGISDSKRGGRTFANYVFFGGLRTQSDQASITFAPGRYVFAGAKPVVRDGQLEPGYVVDFGANAIIRDRNPAGGQVDAGELFIFTDTNYPGLQLPAAIQSMPGRQTTLRQGVARLQAGNDPAYYKRLYGLNRDDLSGVPPDLQPYVPFLLWQDRANSVIKYTADGYIDYDSCGGTLDSPCANTSLLDSRSTQLIIYGSPYMYLSGAIYQPRGSFTRMVGDTAYSGPLHMIIGALRIEGSAKLHLQNMSSIFARRKVALVE